MTYHVSSGTLNLHTHSLFADDTQNLKHGSPNEVPETDSTLAGCAADVIARCAAKSLQLNADMTEVMRFDTAAKLSMILRVGSIGVQRGNQ